MEKTKTRKLMLFMLFTFAAFAASLCFSRAAHALEQFLNVGLTKFDNSQSALIQSTQINVYTDPLGLPVYTFESASGFTIAPSGGGTAVLRDGEPLCISDGTMLIQGTEGSTKLGGVSYRGFIKPITSGAGITIVNYVDIEHYLYGVVPGEMPASWNIEALKAQAVAARSYAYTQAGVHAERGYELCDTVCCQYYPGMSMETENSTNAVNQTAGVIAYYNGEPINAVFASSSGGHTENSENVWSEALGYLRGVKELYENDFLKWERSYTLEAIGNGLAAKGVNIGALTSVTAEYLPSGRVGFLRFTGVNGTHSVRGDAVRGIFSEVGGSLPSTLFKINGFAWSQGGVWDDGAGAAASDTQIYVLGSNGVAPKNISELYAESAGGTAKVSSTVSALGSGGTKAYGGGSQSAAAGVPEGAQNSFTVTSGTISLSGRGNGHGVGMSQFGAKGMAEAGYDYVQILKHYFTGIEVR